MRLVLRSLFLLITCVLVVAGCATDTPASKGAAAPSAPERTGPRQLNEAEILRALRGRTLEGPQSDRSYVRAFCARDGKVSALVDAADGSKHWSGGTWEVREDNLCFRWRNRDWNSGCASVALTGSGTFALKPVSGGPSMSGAKLLDGNPYSLAFN